MSDMDNWQAAQFADECARIAQIIEALEEAEKRGTPKEVINLLAYEAGVGEVYRTGTRNDTHRS